MRAINENQKVKIWLMSRAVVNHNVTVKCSVAGLDRDSVLFVFFIDKKNCSHTGCTHIHVHAGKHRHNSEHLFCETQ